MDPGRRRGIKSIEVAGRVLDELARAQDPVALGELSAASRIYPGKLHRYLVSFVATGLAQQDAATRKYALGPLAMRLGLSALHSHQPLRDAIALQQELRDRFDETLTLSVWSAHGPTIVHIAESSQPIIMTMRVGAVLPMLATASGLAFAAFLPAHFTRGLIRKELKGNGGLTLFASDPAGVARLVKDVRARGFAYNEGHLMQGVNAVAFPLIGRTGSLVAVLAAMGSHQRINLRAGKGLIAELKDAASKFGR